MTLDDDLVVRLEALRAERRASFKEVVNQAIPQGLAAFDNLDDAEVAPRVTRRMPLGRRLVSDIDDVADALAIAEGEDFRRCFCSMRSDTTLMGVPKPRAFRGQLSRPSCPW